MSAISAKNSETDVICWPPKDDRLAAEAERLLNEIQREGYASRARGDETLTIDYTRLSMLLALAIPVVPEDQMAFFDTGAAFAEMLPDSLARQCLKKLLALDASLNPERFSSAMRLYREARWHSHGRPCVRLDPRLIAELMASDIDEEMLDDLRSPWPSFIIRLPEGLVVDPEGRSYTSLGVHTFKRPAPTAEMLTGIEHLPEAVQEIGRKMHEGMTLLAGATWGLYPTTTEGFATWQEEATLAQHMGKTDRVFVVEPRFTPTKFAKRLLEASSRLAASVCLLIQDSGLQKWSEPAKKRKINSRWRSPNQLPQTAEYVVGADVKVSIDCRETVSHYLLGERSSLPKFQWLVRGHWRWQACGPKMADRRRRFIEPYWKGPDKAPILVKLHVVEAAENTDESSEGP